VFAPARTLKLLPSTSASVYSVIRVNAAFA
jgi:hypothetical protein